MLRTLNLFQYTNKGYKHANGGYCYILLVIDCFTKVVYARPLKTKNQFDTALAFESIFKDFTEFPNSIITDDG